MAKRAQEKFLVLMVDDSDDDCLLIQMALREGTDRLRFIGRVPDGQEVVEYLKGAGKYSDRDQFPVPDLMLLDLSLPKKTGFEVLEWLKTQPFEDMVVVVLSGSDKVEDIQKALDLGANYYHPKTDSSTKRLELVKVLEDYLTRGEN